MHKMAQEVCVYFLSDNLITVVQACGTRLYNRLVCRHNIDYVINIEHNRITIVVLAKQEITP